MITVRTADGRTRQLRIIHPPLRLQIRPSPLDDTEATAVPADILRNIFSFLPPLSDDWLSADSACKNWREAFLPLWAGSVSSRTEVAAYLSAFRRVTVKWSKLEGFLGFGVRASLNGPAREKDLASLREAIRPCEIPPPLLASLRIHDGERHRGYSRGMYLGNRLLSAREMADTAQRWRQDADKSWVGMESHSCSIRLPLFSSSAGGRQVAMELSMDGGTELAHGRVILISSFAPYAPHFKVVAGSWEGFLTLF